MTDKLPPNLLALFAPRPALRYLPPIDQAPEARTTPTITPVAQYLDQLHQPDDYVPTESWLQRRDRLKLEKQQKHEKLMTEGFTAFKPDKDPQVRGDALKTLFVARLSYDAKESDLEREFGRFGPIERIRIVANAHDTDASDKKKKKKHRGYAFIVYEREKDMKAAYKETDGIRIKDRRVMVDVERGRLTPGSVVDWAVVATPKQHPPDRVVPAALGRLLVPAASVAASEVASAVAEASAATAALVGAAAAVAVADMVEGEAESATKVVVATMAAVDTAARATDTPTDSLRLMPRQALAVAEVAALARVGMATAVPTARPAAVVGMETLAAAAHMMTGDTRPVAAAATATVAMGDRAGGVEAIGSR
ncbi:MAG: hypothetical protein M1838_000815 [Thelocarpon superellum]|nr:MAG: hypothetical protein M1838_000815 [Thelocarpon superellum]